ncbi:DUF4258 domain-containing protein [Lutibacter sp.]
MKFIHRLFYYGIGLTIGIFAVKFFLNKKGTPSFDYLPNARVLKNIRIKNRLFSSEANQQMQQFSVDTAAISEILRTGDVDFSHSKIKVDSCKIYTIDGVVKEKNIQLIIKNCDSTAIIDKVIVE